MRAAEGLSKLVSELKEYLILNDFSSINTTITSRTRDLETFQNQMQKDMAQQLEHARLSNGTGGSGSGGPT